MNRDIFEKLLDELDGNSINTLKEKNARYSSPDDCLHNFNAGGDIFGGTPAQACWGYLTKHLVALRDMIERNDFSNRDDFLEKCQDSINYIRFLWCIGNEGRSEIEEKPKHITVVENRNDMVYVENRNDMVYTVIDFKHHNDAESVMSDILHILDIYGTVTLADIYRLVHITPVYTDNQIIWTNVAGLRVELKMNGEECSLILPMPDKFKEEKEND